MAAGAAAGRSGARRRAGPGPPQPGPAPAIMTRMAAAGRFNTDWERTVKPARAAAIVTFNLVDSPGPPGPGRAAGAGEPLPGVDSEPGPGQPGWPQILTVRLT